MNGFSKKIFIINTFYKRFRLSSLLLSTFGLFWFWEYGFRVFTIIFWFKLVSYGIIYLLINQYNSNEYKYYENLGVSKSILWTITLSFDFILFIISVLLLNRFK